MAHYYPISPLFWTDAEVRGWSDNTKLLALYLLTCDHRNLEGLYRLPLAYVEADLGWAPDDLTGYIDPLYKADFCRYDEAAQVILIPRALKYHQPRSTPQVTGAVRALKAVPDTTLWGDFVEIARDLAPELYAALTGEA